MHQSPDIANSQSGRVASSHEELRERIARISDMDPVLLSHDLFLSDGSISPVRTDCSSTDEPIASTDTGQSDSLSHNNGESDNSRDEQTSNRSLEETYPNESLHSINETEHEQSSHRLLEVDPAEISEPSSEMQHRSSSHGLSETVELEQLSHHLREVEEGCHGSIASWLPFYLRKSTSLLFLATFALMIAALEILFTLSLQHSGISVGTSSMRYLWSYGTTGILTLTAAFWHRLDYETKVAAPWFKANPITASKKALMIDYVDAWSFLVPFKAFGNRDYEVALSSTVSLLLQVVIVLSTALFALVPTTSVNEAEPIFLTSQFVDDPARLKNSDSLLPYYITMGTEPIQNLITNLGDLRDPPAKDPEGFTNQFVYQTFEPAFSGPVEVNATVDGMALDLVCETANVKTQEIQMPKVWLSEEVYPSFHGDLPFFEVNHEGCETRIYWNISTFDFGNEYNHYPNNQTFRENGMMLSSVPGFARGQCNSTDKDAHRLVFLSVEMDWRLTNQTSIIANNRNTTVRDVDATVARSVALACAPFLEQPRFSVSRNSKGVQSVSPMHETPGNVFKAIHPWDFVDFFSSGVFLSDVAVMAEVVTGDTPVWADDHSKVVLGFCGSACNETSGRLNGTILESFLAKSISSYVAATAHALLKERTSITSTGTSSSSAVRLWVEPIVCQTMVALLAILVLIILWNQFEHKEKLTRRVNPGSLAATTILVAQVASSNFPKDFGSSTTKQLNGQLDKFLFDGPSTNSFSRGDSLSMHESAESDAPESVKKKEQSVSSGKSIFQNPMPLRPMSRIPLFISIIACAITLMILLYKSTNEEGLGDGAGSKYHLYAWTIVPAMILTVISWWISSIDTQVRLLAPWNSLKRGGCGASVLQEDLLRGLIPAVLYQQLRSSNFAAIGTTIAALLGAILTTVSAAMFHVVIYPISSPAELLPSTVFTTPTPRQEMTFNSSSMGIVYESPTYAQTSRLSSMILETNLSYSQEVFQDLIFSTFSLAANKTEKSSLATNVSLATIQFTAPALRPRLSCRVYDQADITAVYVRDNLLPWSGDSLNGIAVNITMEQGCSNVPYDHFANALFQTGNFSEFLFGAAYDNPTETIMVGGCSSMLYIWGHHNSIPGTVANISAVGCNNTVELVDVNLSLFEEDLSLDISNPPKAIESTARDIQGHGAIDSFDSKVIYDRLAPLAAADGMVSDSFFQQLVTSPFAMPMSAIGDPSQSESVLNAIRLQHGIIEAQFLSANYRLNIDTADVKENASHVLIPTLLNDSWAGGLPRFPANVTYPFGKERVVQDATATAVLEALLLSILVLLVLGWWLGPKEPVLPRSPTSVASVLALLAGGNLLEHIYDGSPEPLCWEDFESRLGKDSSFYLGLDSSAGDGTSTERRFGIWMINEQNQESGS